MRSASLTSGIDSINFNVTQGDPLEPIACTHAVETLFRHVYKQD